MSCDCYRIGGPFITFDPECPAHGLEAQAKEREREKEEAARDKKEAEDSATIDAMRERLSQDAQRIEVMQAEIQQLRAEIKRLKALTGGRRNMH